MKGEFLSEHRKLVSVFMKLLGLGPKPCDVESLEIVHEATRATQRAIQRYQGTITRLITDDKGTRFLIAFGLPGHAHEDDEARAVQASLEVAAPRDAQLYVTTRDCSYCMSLAVAHRWRPPFTRCLRTGNRTPRWTRSRRALSAAYSARR